MVEPDKTVYEEFYCGTYYMGDSNSDFNMRAIDALKEAGYKFVSDGTWYAKGTEAIPFFALHHEGTLIEAIDAYVAGDHDESGLFGGWRDKTRSLSADNVNYSDGWDEEDCGFAEFDIYKNGILVKKATRAKPEDWGDDSNNQLP